MARSARHDYLPVSDPLPAFWSRDKDEFFDHRTTPDLPTRSDIVIIGAGYAGTATAWHLINDADNSKPGRSITVLEARGVCEGATGRNGGHVRPDLYGRIPRVIQRDGLDAAVELAEFEIAHVTALKRVVEQENIDCDFVLTRSIDVHCDQKAADDAKRVYEAMSKHNLTYMDDVFFTHGPDAERYSRVKGAKSASSYTAGMMWPYKFISHLLKAMVKSGDINLQSNTPVTEVRKTAEGKFEVATPRGTIITQKVIYANNGYVAGLMPEYSHNIIPCKGICSHISVSDGSKMAPLLSNTYIERQPDLTGSYLIPRIDGSIVVGGAAKCFRPYRDQWYNNVDDSVLIEKAKDYYDGYMQRTFHGWEETDAKVDKLWTGVMGYSYDSEAHIGPIPSRTD